MQFVEREIGGVPILQVDAWHERGLVHGFFGRELDIAKSRDSWNSVMEGQTLLLLTQHHSKTIIHFRTPGSPPDWAALESEPLAGDAWIIDPKEEFLADVCVGVKTADCLPILISNPRNSVVAAIHCGWRGAEAGLFLDTLVLLGRMGVPPKAIEVAIGPGAQSCCYEIRDDVKAPLDRAMSLVESFPGPDSKPAVQSRDGKYFASLKDLLLAQAYFFGIRREHIVASEICTICDGRYFSHRRDKEAAGRQVSFIGGLPNT
ncbi:MAG: polyphenol oxidase family protein [Deltaproteobacteria bacterium]|nr:polyphenol oxidase family protein [Deltaproteobacteria bacterium]